MESTEMKRLRLEQAAQIEEMKARMAREAVSQFDNMQRLLDQEELTHAKRRIQELEARERAPPAKRPALLSRGTQSLSAFGFTSSRPDPKIQPLLLRCDGCDRLFETQQQRASHLKAHVHMSRRPSAEDKQPPHVVSAELTLLPSSVKEEQAEVVFCCCLSSKLL